MEATVVLGLGFRRKESFLRLAEHSGSVSREGRKKGGLNVHAYILEGPNFDRVSFILPSS